MTSSERPGTWRIGRVAGVDVLIKPSLLLMGAALVLVFAPQYGDRPDTSPYILATVFVVLLYASVLLHEIAHVVVARAFSMRVPSVTLHLLGGETLIEGESRTPWQELSTSLAGPLASLAIGLGALGVSDAMSEGTSADIIWSLGYVNVFIAIFNMLPGIPLDGGRVFKALIWQITGREDTGTRIAAWIGRGAAIAMVALAIVLFVSDGSSAITVLIGLFVAFFLWQGAGDALHNITRATRIRQLVARDIAFPGATPPPGATQLSADLRGAELLKAMAARPAEAYSLIEDDGSVFGVLTARAVDETYRASRS